MFNEACIGDIIVDRAGGALFIIVKASSEQIDLRCIKGSHPYATNCDNLIPFYGPSHDFYQRTSFRLKSRTELGKVLYG